MFRDRESLSKNEMSTSCRNTNGSCHWRDFFTCIFFLRGLTLYQDKRTNNSLSKFTVEIGTNTKVCKFSKSSGWRTQIQQTKLQALRNAHKFLLDDFGNVLSVEDHRRTHKEQTKRTMSYQCQNLTDCSEPSKNLRLGHGPLVHCNVRPARSTFLSVRHWLKS